MVPRTPRPRSRGLKLVALLCTALLSCTTVRTHVGGVPGEVRVEDGRVDPQVELWVEGNEPLGEAEAARYRGEVKSALAQALAGRDQPEGDALLVVRSQGVTRTAGRKSDQTAAAVGMVVGVVVIVAAVVLAVVYGSKGRGGGHRHAGRPSAGSSHGASGGPAQAPAVRPPRSAPPRFTSASRVARPPRPAGVGLPPRPGPAPVRPSIPAPRPSPAPGFGPWRPHPHDHGPDVWLGVEVWLPWPEPPPAYVMPPPFAGPPPEPEAEPEPGAEPEEKEWLSIPPPEPLDVDERGFFDGDRLRLEALVVDRRTGEVLWRKQVSRKADPRDPRAVKAAVDDLLKEGGWQPPAS